MYHTLRDALCTSMGHRPGRLLLQLWQTSRVLDVAIACLHNTPSSLLRCATPRLSSTLSTLTAHLPRLSLSSDLLCPCCQTLPDTFQLRRSTSALYQRCSIVTGMEGHYCFQGVRDRYSGITVSSSEEPVPAQDFEQILQASLHQWRKERVRGVWFRVDLRHADWVPVLARYGFTYHHAKTDFVMMVQWLPMNEPNNIPRYAHTLIGVGAFVVNDKDELLVVQERFYSKPHWKLPGGYVEFNEDLGAAAVREVKEETGIEAEFVSLVAFRHVHNAAFCCSDMYFIVHMRPITSQIIMCKKELSACEWMKIERYINNPKVNKMNRFFAKQYLESRRKGMQLQASPMYHPFVKRNIMVYSIGHELHSENNSNEAQASAEGHSACNGDPKL